MAGNFFFIFVKYMETIPKILTFWGGGEGVSSSSEMLFFFLCIFFLAVRIVYMYNVHKQFYFTYV